MPEAQRLPLKDLNAAVERAVSMAADRRKLSAEVPVFGGDFYRVPWWIAGRKLRDQVNLDEAYEFAEQVSEAVSKEAGIDLVPAVTIIDKDILCGFIERFEGGILPPLGRIGGAP